MIFLTFASPEKRSVQGTSSSTCDKLKEWGLLQLLYIQYFDFAEEIDYMLPVGPLPTILMPSIPMQLFFSLLLMHKDFAYLLSLFGTVVFLQL